MLVKVKDLIRELQKHDEELEILIELKAGVCLDRNIGIYATKVISYPHNTYAYPTTLNKKLAEKVLVIC